MQKRAELLEAPQGNLLFTLKDITYTPERPRLKVPFTVRGKVELFKLPFVLPIWVIVTATYPEQWWEEIIPLIGSPEVRESATVIGGDFEITFRKGFDREGDFGLAVRAYAGPTFSLDKITIPPFPPVATEETTFMVAGEVPPEEAGFRNFRIASYSKNTGPQVTPPGVLELEVGDRLRINLGFDHRNGEVTGKFHAAIWQKTFLDPHDEVLNVEKTFSVPSSADWQPVTDYIEIPITSAIAPGTEYGLYVKIMSITGGDIFTEYLANVITILGPPELGFDLTRPTASQTPVDPGTMIDITCPVTSRSTVAVDVRAKVIIYEGSIFPGHGAKIREYDSGLFHIEPGETKDVVIHHITVVGTIDRRDVEVEIYANTRLIKESEWDDVFKVTQPSEIPTSDIGPLDRFAVKEGTYDLGDTVPWSLPYTYKGKAQSGWLTISLGTGVVPSFFTKHTFPRIPITFEKRYDWDEFHESGSFTLPTTLEPGQTYTVRAKLETADGKQETDTDWGVIKIREEIVAVEFSLSRPTAYPYRSPPGLVLITCPVISRSSINVTAQVKCIVYEGSVLPGHGTKLWESTKTITISPSGAKDVQFMRTSVVGTIDRRDVGVQVRVEGRLIKEDEWDDVYYVEEALPVGISFQVSIWGIPDFGSYDDWSCSYWDPGINDFVGDRKWYRSYAKIAFSNVKSGGYLAVFLKRNTTVSRQYTSPTFASVDGGNYTFDVERGVIYG